MEIKFKPLHKLAQVPLQASRGAANFDFYCTEIEKEGTLYRLKFGIAVEIPKLTKLVIVPRSGLTKHNFVMVNSPGQVDEDYRGELEIRLRAIPTGIDTEGDHWQHELTYENLPYKVGDRVAQGFLEVVLPVTFTETNVLSETIRGTGGFGSTGKN